MSVPTGEELFEHYLSEVEFEVGENPPLAKPSNEELNEHYDIFLTGRLNAQFDGVLLDNIREAADQAYDRAKVLEFYPP